jgi:hypothetical protein
MFDSVIAWYSLRYTIKEDVYNINDYIPIEIPVLKWGKEDEFYFITGIMDYPSLTTFWVKRYEKRFLEAVKDKTVRTNQGKFKNYKQPLLYSEIQKATIKGIENIEILEKILPQKAWLGKKTSSGWGQCELELIEDNSITIDNILVDNKKLVRNIPISYPGIQSGIIGKYPVRFPYYGIHSKKVDCFSRFGRVIKENNQVFSKRLLCHFPSI